MRHDILHTTDLYHPHGDPDDHFDLALQFALHLRNDTQLLRIVLDHPARNPTGACSPGIVAVAQLNAITGADVPCSLGSPAGVRGCGDALDSLPPRDRSGVEAILRTLRDSDGPVRIVVVGDCSDVAAAFFRDPELFRTKCGRVYVNAGTGHITGGREREWNAVLNPAAYAAMFALPCPVLWCPCFHRIAPEPDYFGLENEGENGSVFRAEQGPLFSGMSRRLRNYFAYMFEESCDPMWLDALDRREASPALEAEVGRERRFYSTAGILHAAGLAVEPDGTPVNEEAAADPVFRFAPIEVRCDETGRTEWRYAPPGSGRYILQITRREAYAGAMARAMRRLLLEVTEE